MIIPAGFAQITHFFQGASVPRGAVVTYGVLNDSGFTATQVATRAAAAYDSSNLDAVTAANCDMTITRAKLGPNLTGPFADVVATTGGAGGASGGAQVCYLLNKDTGEGGRSSRGRMFLPGVPEANVDEGGALTSGTLSTLQNAATQLISDLITQAIPMVLLHATVGPTPADVIRLTPSTFVATQRRRQPRRLF